MSAHAGTILAPPAITHPGEHSGGQAGQLNGGTSPTGDHGASGSAASARRFLIAMGLLVAFVIVMTLVAGISPAVGKTVAAFFAAMLVLQGITHANPFVSWVQKHPLTPTTT